MGRRKTGWWPVLLILGVMLLLRHAGTGRGWEGVWEKLPWNRENGPEVTAERLTPDPFAGLDQKLLVTFLDVGQGNAVLVRSGGQAMMVDGGPAEASSYVVRTLKNWGIDRLDIVVATHYDADHISGLVGVLNRLEVGLLLNPGYEADTHIYDSFVRKREENGCAVHIPVPGEHYSLGEAELTVVAPSSYDAGEDNNNSIGIRLACQDTAFLLLGDAEWKSEKAMLESGLDLRADVYLASHHGSAYSGSIELLEAVNPSAAVISVGADNPFGHPAESTLRKLEERGIEVYRTDQQGTITACSDGSGVFFDCLPAGEAAGERLKQEGTGEIPPEAAYIGNKNSYRFHRPGCENLPAEHNRIFFSTREEALEAGFDPCGNCRP